MNTTQPEDRHDWIGAIVTVSGKGFDLLEPDWHDVDIEDIAHALSLICRFNGHVPTFYSVAEHCVRVAARLPDELKLAGLLHDAAEAYIGDMTRPLKRSEPLGPAYLDVEARIEQAIGEAFVVELHPMHPLVADADKRQFEWESEHIRTARECGWSSEYARQAFLAGFDAYTA